MVLLRQKNQCDYDWVARINEGALRQQYETNLVNKLRRSTTTWIPGLSLVAKGYILLTAVQVLLWLHLLLIQSIKNLVLVKHWFEQGIRKTAEINFRSVNVLGRKDSYFKLGFEPASKYNITCPFDLPDPDVFRLVGLAKNGLDGMSGKSWICQGVIFFFQNRK